MASESREIRKQCSGRRREKNTQGAEIKRETKSCEWTGSAIP